MESNRQPTENPQVDEAPRVDKEWLSALAERKFHQVLSTVSEKKPPSAGDFVKLVELHWQRNPAKLSPRSIVWVDSLDEEPANGQPETPGVLH